MFATGGEWPFDSPILVNARSAIGGGQFTETTCLLRQLLPSFQSFFVLLRRKLFLAQCMSLRVLLLFLINALVTECPRCVQSLPAWQLIAVVWGRSPAIKRLGIPTANIFAVLRGILEDSYYKHCQVADSRSPELHRCSAQQQLRWDFSVMVGSRDAA